LRNDGGRAGDVLVLTKPLGTGILTTARRDDAIGDDALMQAIASMEMLNRDACELMLAHGARAATDVTGFGFLGHLREMMGSRLGARIVARDVPLFDGVLALAARDVVPGGTRKNLENALQNGAVFDEGVAEPVRLALADAQTSGGLLIAIEPARAQALLQALRARSIPAARVGELTESRAIVVTDG
jgi:selenide,water dikinase